MTLMNLQKLKDSEIDILNQQISNLQTLVQIESLKIKNESNLHNDNILHHDYSYN